MCDQNVKWSSRNLQYRTGLGCVVCKWYWMSNLLVRTQAKHLMQRVRLHPRFTTLYLSELFCEPRLRLSCLNLTQLQPKRWQKTSVTNNQLVSLYANVLHTVVRKHQLRGNHGTKTTNRLMNIESVWGYEAIHEELLKLYLLEFNLDHV